jgi:hypothetical protein
MTAKFSRFVLLAVAVITLTFTASSRAAIPPAENILPSDTLLLITVPDFSALRSAARQSPQWLFWNDPAMKPFRDKFMAKWHDEFAAPLEQGLGIKLNDFADLLQGQLTFAITQNGWDGKGDQKPGVILLLDAKDKSDLLATNLAKIRQKWTDAGKSIHTETVRGINFSIVPLSSNNIPEALSKFFPRHESTQELGKDNKPPPPGELVIGQFQSLLIVGDSTKAVEPVAARLTGGGIPSLSENANFAADAPAQFHGSPLYYGWFNAKTFFNVLARIPPPEPNPDAPSPMPQIPWNNVLVASGLTGVKSVAFSYRETHDGAQLNFSIAAPESARQGLLKMIAVSQKDANPPPFVPADAVKFSRWRVDGQRSWAALEKMLGDISPAWLGSLNSALDMVNATAQQQDPDFDIRKNLIGNLGDDFISYQKAPAGKTPADLNSPPSLFLFSSPHADQEVLALKDVMGIASMGNPPKTRDFLGRKIYSAALANPRAAATGSAPAQRSIYWSSANGYVAITSDVSMLEEFLRGSENHAKPLNETAGLADAAQHVGGMGNGLFGYQNQHDLMRTMFTALKNEPATPSSFDRLGSLFNLPFGSPQKSFSDWLDFSLLPDFDQVSKYFYFSVYSGDTTADGLSFKVFAPRPPQMN